MRCYTFLAKVVKLTDPHKRFKGESAAKATILHNSATIRIDIDAKKHLPHSSFLIPCIVTSDAITKGGTERGSAESK